MRIGATISSFEQRLLRTLAQSNSQVQFHAFRLATGKKVNRPADDPSAFVYNSQLEQRRSAVQSAVSQVSAASDFAAESQLVLEQIRDQLDVIRAALLEDEDQSLTSSEREEKQAEIDAAIAQINELAKTNVSGRQPFDGSNDYHKSGLNSSQIKELRVLRYQDTNISGSVTTAAQRASLNYAGKAGSLVQANATFTLTGKRGSTTITVTQDEALSDVATRINNDSHKTGITASVAGNDLTFQTVDYGTEATIAVEVTSGTFNVTGGNGDGTAEGVDAEAVINGRTLTADGNRFTYNANGLHFDLEVQAGFSGALATVDLEEGRSFQFSLTPDPSRTTRLGLAGLQAAQMGGLSGTLDQLLSGGSLAGLGTNTSQALRVVDESLGKLTRVEGQVEGFADAAVASSAALWNDIETKLDEALEQSNGINEDEENSLLDHYQGLASNAAASLAVLQQQRSAILDLIKQIAGL